VLLKKILQTLGGAVLWLFGFLGVWGAGAVVLAGGKGWTPLLGLLWAVLICPAIYYGWRLMAAALDENPPNTTSPNVQVWSRD
jgi:hypothetical protein